MIGNDIVDLKQAALDSNWQRPRFLDKIFTEKEKELIYSSENQSETVWLLWSMKEAVYKITLQEGEKRSFNPRQLDCILLADQGGRVHFKERKYNTKSEICHDFISTFAYLGELKKIEHRTFQFEENDYSFQSETVQQKLLHFFSEQTNTEIHDLEIRKTEQNIPWLFWKTNRQKRSFSLSHHGFYGAFAVSH